MVLKACRITLEWVVAVAVGLALLAGLGLFWLSREPLQVDFLAPYVESALSSERVRIDVGGTQLVWAGWGSRIEVAARDWQVFGEDDRRLMAVPHASVQLSLSALLRGQLAPTSITLHGLRISLLRQADGRFAFDDQPSAEEAGEGAVGGEAAERSMLEFLFSELGSSPQQDDPFAQLASVTIADTSAVLIDQRMRTVWRAPEVNLRILRDTSGISAVGTAVIALGGQHSRLDLTMTKLAGTPGLETVVRLDALQPAALADVLPGLEELRRISGAISGQIGLTIGPDGEPTDMAASLSGTEIRVELPDRLEQPLVVRGLSVEAHDPGGGAPLVLDRLEGSLAPAAGGSGPSFVAEAIVEPAGALHRVKLMLDLGPVPAADIRLYWPKGVGNNGRAWVIENITGGEASAATLATTVTLDREDYSVQAIESFGGRFRYEDLEVHYLRPLPPLTGATGSAAYDLAGLDFTVDEARQGGIAIDNGGISIFGLDGKDHRIALEFDGSGRLSEILGLLDHERLALLDNLGIEPEAASGSFQANASFAFPLVDELTFEQVQVGVEGSLADVDLEGGVAGYDLTDGRFDLSLDAESLRAGGTGVVAGIPLDATWSESFQAVEQPTQVTATVPSVSVAQLATFGLNLGDYAEGLLSLNLDIAGDHRGNSRLDIAANLTEVEARIPLLAWEKPRGEAGALSGTITIENDRVSRVGDLVAELGEDFARGEIHFGAEGRVERVSFEELALGNSSITGLNVTPYQGDGFALSVRTGVLDLEPLLAGPAGAEASGQEATGEEATERDEMAGTEPAAGPPYVPLRVEAPALSRVRLAEGRALEHVTLELERNHSGWQLIRAEARIPRQLWRHQNRPVPEDATLAEKAMSLYYRPEGDGSYRFELFADDIGATLRAFGLIDSLEGGQGEIVGHLPGPLPQAPLNGRLETKGFRLVEAPGMAKLLTVASLTGIGNLLSGEGIEFDRAVGEFTLDDDLLTTPLLRAYGSSLGITARGQVDLEADGTDISGTLVPAYSVNHVLNQIPIIGDILTGGEGEGILGVTYRVTGDIDDPTVAVNPLSILAPGFLRGLFGVPGGSDTPTELNDAFPEGHR